MVSTTCGQRFSGEEQQDHLTHLLHWLASFLAVLQIAPVLLQEYGSQHVRPVVPTNPLDYCSKWKAPLEAGDFPESRGARWASNGRYGWLFSTFLPQTTNSGNSDRKSTRLNSSHLGI